MGVGLGSKVEYPSYIMFDIGPLSSAAPLSPSMVNLRSMRFLLPGLAISSGRSLLLDGKRIRTQSDAMPLHQNTANGTIGRIAVAVPCIILFYRAMIRAPIFFHVAKTRSTPLISAIARFCTGTACTGCCQFGVPGVRWYVTLDPVEKFLVSHPVAVGVESSFDVSTPSGSGVWELSNC